MKYRNLAARMEAAQRLDARRRWADDDGGVVANDREEQRDAARFDRTTYRRIGGLLYDADLVPDLADVTFEGER